MTSLIATPNNSTGSVDLSISKTATVTKVVRTNVNGSEEVRSSTGQIPSTGAGTLILTDYEASHGLNSYNAYMGPEVRTNLATNPGMAVGSTAATIAINLVPNPSFETGTAGVSTSSTVTVNQTAFGSALVSGNYAMNIAIGPSSTAFTYVYQTVAVSAASWLTWAVNTRWSSGSRYAKLKIDFRDVSNISVGSVTSAVFQPASNSTGGTRSIISGLAPATTTQALIFIYFYDDAAGTVAPVDGTILASDAWHAASATDQTRAEGLIANYFDGSTPAGGDYTYAWSGTAWASSSLKKAVPVTGFTAVAGGNGAGYTMRSTDTPRTGTYIARMVWDRAGTAGSAGVIYQHTDFSGVAGDVRSATVWVRSSVAKTVTLLLRIRNNTTAVGSVQPAYIDLQPNTWTELRAENAVATGSYTNIQAYVLISNANTQNIGDTFDMNSVTVEAGPVAGNAFDGSTPDVTDVNYAWTGAVDASSSTETSTNVIVTGSVTLDVDKPWLSVPVMPQYSEQVETITQFGAGREASTTVHRPLGRSDSLVVMGKLGDRTGSLEVFCKSYAEARKLERIFERGEVVQLRQRVEGMDMYFTATSIPVSPYSVQGEDTTRWAMVINYVEVRRPIGVLAGALGWTFDELASSAASFDVITQAYATFDALTLGDANV